MELTEKLEAALVAYFDTLTWPDSLAGRIFPGEGDDEKDGQCLLCIAEDSGTEEPPMSGNRHYPVMIELRTPITSTLDEHKAAAAILESGIQVTGLSDLINAAAYAKAIAEPDEFSDLANFCCYPITERTPTREQNENYWASGFALKIYCMGIAG